MARKVVDFLQADAAMVEAVKRLLESGRAERDALADVGREYGTGTQLLERIVRRLRPRLLARKPTPRWELLAD